MLPTSFLSTCLLMIPPSEYSTDADMSRTVALGYVSFVIVYFRLFSLISCLVNGHGITLIASERPYMETFARQLVCILFVNSLYNRKLFCIFEH